MVKIYILLLLVMLMWGLNLSALKVLVDAIDPMLLTSFRIMTAGVVVLIICAVMGIFRLPRKHEWLVIFYIAIFNVVLHHSFVAIGLDLTSGINGGLILGMMPLVTVMMTVIILRERVTWLRVSGFILGFIGVVVTTLTGADGLAAISLGDFIVFLGVIVQGFSFVLISKLKPTFDPRLATGYMLLLGSVFIFILSQAFGSEIQEITYLFDWKLGAVFLFSAVFASAFGHMTYNYAIKKVGPAEAALFINMNTLFAITGASIFLNEVITMNHIVGFILILSGVFIGTGAVEYMLMKRRGT
ncbi:EamA domain-containing membrane protein RarD [Virgibacillus subterraneus]|uniref:EamA domain-containing membrane protein RarD n=2 Tax=Virgibacillus TaxID=84406 RepID=A0A1H0YQZ6_9BACI|nr:MULTISPECIES: DMT family transporter [Virgibacillus]SDQ17550.1 EamA domain-containing membrane protein RarD [Virgibacillus salinus]SEP79719.1 EamA domain-containing membrane protein RarD [Virgibacillus subterraneus]